MTVPVFPGVVIPSVGLCCKIQVPPWGAFPIPMVALPIAFPQSVITAYSTFVSALQALYDEIQIPCPCDNAQAAGQQH